MIYYVQFITSFQQLETHMSTINLNNNVPLYKIFDQLPNSFTGNWIWTNTCQECKLQVIRKLCGSNYNWTHLVILPTDNWFNEISVIEELRAGTKQLIINILWPIPLPTNKLIPFGSDREETVRVNVIYFLLGLRNIRFRNNFSRAHRHGIHSTWRPNK